LLIISLLSDPFLCYYFYRKAEALNFKITSL